jgi:hypothetical protein
VVQYDEQHACGAEEERERVQLGVGDHFPFFFFGEGRVDWPLKGSLEVVAVGGICVVDWTGLGCFEFCVSGLVGGMGLTS